MIAAADRTVDLPLNSADVYHVHASPSRGSALTHVLGRKRYRALLLTSDFLAVWMAWFIAVETRLAMNSLLARSITREELLSCVPLPHELFILWIVASLYFRVYSLNNRTAAKSLKSVSESVFAVSALVIVVTFLSGQTGINLSRSFVLIFVPVSFLIMTAARYGALVVAAGLEERWPAPERVAVVGSGKKVHAIIERLRVAAGNTIDVKGVILPMAAASLDGLPDSAPLLGGTEDLGALVNQHTLDRLIVVDGQLDEVELEYCLHIAKRMNVNTSRSFETLGSDARMEFTSLYGIPLLELKAVSFGRRQEIAKRVFDVIGAACLVMLLSPLMMLLALLVKVTSRGPVFFKAPRVGRGGRYFTFLKFRSMYHEEDGRQRVRQENELGGHVFKMRNDPRVTPLGRFMRRYSLDELPQFFNVLRGEMSLVGPRPLPAEDLDPDGQSRDFYTWSEQRSAVLPGITGLWQISGRSELQFDQWVELDLSYIRNWSLKLDLKILLETPLVVVTAKGAY